MMKKDRLKIPLKKLCMIGLMIVLVACTPLTPAPPTQTPSVTSTDSPPPTDTPTATPTPPLVEICTENEAELQIPREDNGYFIENQMLIIGPQQAMESALESISLNLSAQNLVLVLLEECDLSFLSAAEFNPFHMEEKETRTNWRFTSEDVESLVTRLYELQPDPNATPDPNTTPDPNLTLETYISIVNSAGNSSNVFAEPNYLISASQNPKGCGQPFSGGGSGGGTPYGEPGIPDVDVSGEFMEQWAWRSEGIDAGNSSFTGEGVQFFAFDTSPFGDPTQLQNPFPAQPTELTLDVVNGITVPLMPDPDDPDVSDHGLSVVGHAHAVAQDAGIHLIQILNDQGCGALSDIIDELIKVIFQMSFIPGQQEGLMMRDVVLGFSLSVHLPDEEQQNSPAGQQIDWELLLLELGEPGELELVGLETVIYAAQAMQGVIVAAAGNDSTPDQAAPEHLPAAYDLVFAVAAIDNKGERSCYSNQGDVGIPGGNGGVDPNNPDNPCIPRAASWNETPPTPPCERMADCPYGLINLSYRATDNQSGYTFGAGTSYAAPIFSGITMQILHKIGGNLPPVPTIVCLLSSGGLSPTPDIRWGIVKIDPVINASGCI